MAELVLSNRDLLLSFEGIGDNCEFGIAQRCCGVEPLGLFRFSGSSIGNLTDCFQTRLAHLFQVGRINVFEEPRTNEYMYTCFHYHDFPNHTEIPLSNTDIDDVTRRIRRKIDFLKQRFVEDLDTGEKIFLRTGRECRDKVFALHDALKLHGPNRLLWIREADQGHPAGTVEVVRPGLAIGYVGYYKDFAKDQPIDLDNWLSVLKRAYLALPRDGHPSAVVFEANRTVATSGEWLAHRRAAVVPIVPRDAASPGIGTVTALQLRADAGPADAWALCEIDHGLAPRTTVVFSAWVLVPEGFGGSRISVWAGTEVTFANLADLSIRNAWQRLWAIARVPKGGGAFVPYLMADGRERDLLLLSDWSLETGIAPAEATARVRGGDRPARSNLVRAYALADALLPSRGEPLSGASRLWTSAASTIERLIAAGRFAEADDLCRLCLARFPHDAALLKLYATSAHNHGRHLSAVPRWEAAAAAAPDDPMCVAGLACNLRHVGDLARASALVTLALPRHGDDIVLRTEAARVFQAAGDDERALAQWNAVMALPDTHPDWACARIDLLMRLGRVDEASDAFARATDRGQTDHPGLLRLGSDLHRLRPATASAG